MLNRYKKISVIGLGYIGLPTAALLASKGYLVNGIDIDENVVRTINDGRIHIVEPGLEEYVKCAVLNKNLKAHSEVQPGDIFMICVPTPFHENTKIPSPNVEYIRAAAENIAPLIKEQDIVILESTSPVGTTDMVKDILQKNGVDTSKIYLAYCPERVLPGKIIDELVNNARVIGGTDSQSTEIVSAFYATFVNGKILKTNAKTAEMCKLTENSFRDVNIAFANELSILCEKNGVDIWDLIELANNHPRVNILQPSTGVGGHCIAVDPWFIVADDPLNSKIIKTAREINDYKPEWVVKKIIDNANLNTARKVACLGLAFKPNIDDLRESPATKVVDSLIKANYEIYCVEPNLRSHNKYKLVDIDTALKECDLFVFLVNHKEFSSASFLNKLPKERTLDFCGILKNAKLSIEKKSKRRF